MAEDAQRLDKWIWFARFLRSRAAAADLIKAGHVRLNGRRILQPGHRVREGDVLTLALPGRTLLAKIVAFAERRGGAAAAAALWQPVAETSSSSEDDA